MANSSSIIEECETPSASLDKEFARELDETLQNSGPVESGINAAEVISTVRREVVEIIKRAFHDEHPV